MNPARFRQLDPDELTATLDRLSNHIKSIFPNSGLSRVCQELHKVSASAKTKAEAISRKNIWLRLACFVWAVIISAIPVVTFIALRPQTGVLTLSDFIQSMEAGINDIVFLGVGIFFLLTLESRFRRRKVLEAIYELRSFAHIIDMHQLAKDPVGVVRLRPSRVEGRLTPSQLLIYLDFCSEMLSHCGKLAAIYTQNLSDPVAITAVDEIESLTNGLSRKIWQKMTMIQSHAQAEGPLPPIEEGV